MADLVDPDGVNPQRLVDVMNDLQASVEMGTGKTRTTIADTRKLLDKHLAIIVDTQTLKSGGLPGPKGPDGRQGYPGYQGAVGAEGDRGPTGNVGEIGSKGFPGPQGLRGKLGDTGPEGARGGKGITGPPGFDGPLGPKGQLGTPGARGPRGPRGMAGYQGLRGAQVFHPLVAFCAVLSSALVVWTCAVACHVSPCRSRLDIPSQNIRFTPVDHVAHVLREMMANTTFVQLASSETCKGSTRCDKCTFAQVDFHKSFSTCLPPPPLARRNRLVHPHGTAHRFVLRLGGRGTGEEGGMVFSGRAAEENVVMWHCGGYFLY